MAFITSHKKARITGLFCGSILATALSRRYFGWPALQVVDASLLSDR